MTSTLAPAPTHIPANMIHDVDIYGIEGGNSDHLKAWNVLQGSTPDIYYSRHYGGFWILNRAAHIAQVLQDAARFSSAQSTSIPPIKDTPPFPPLYIDPPLHRYFRKPLSLAFGGQNPKILGTKAREIVIELIEKVRAKGECEFMRDFALHIPVAIVLATFDLPFEDRERLIPYADTITHSSDQQERDQAIQGVFAYAEEWVARRRTSPGEDLISQLLEVMIEDRPITHEEATAMVSLILLGGLDSVSHTMGAIMRSLAERPDLQKRFATDPALIPAALNELLRRHSVNAMARTVTEDTMVGEVAMKKGDKILLAAWLYGLDDTKWTDPLTIDIDRKPEIMAFGTGIHTCVGMSLARLEIRTLLEEWFARIPAFTVKAGERPVTMTGQTLGTLFLPLSWAIPTGGG